MQNTDSLLRRLKATYQAAGAAHFTTPILRRDLCAVIEALERLAAIEAATARPRPAQTPTGQASAGSA